MIRVKNKNELIGKLVDNDGVCPLCKGVMEVDDNDWDGISEIWYAHCPNCKAKLTLKRVWVIMKIGWLEWSVINVVKCY